MSDVTRILNSIERGDPKAAEELLPLVYEELRKLAAARMARELPGQTLQATALVHEAWLRLTGNENQKWEGRGHFFAAAAEAMRRILVERARGRQRLRHGGGQERVDLAEMEIPMVPEDEKVLQVNEVLGELEAEDAVQAQIVKMKFFMGMKAEEIAEALRVSEKTVQRQWAHAKAWLYQRIRKGF
jgi:RNA polymerase sigma factor (TIGR02999 family)